MTKVEEAKAALWGQLVDSGELGEDDANVLLDNLVEAAKEEEALREHFLWIKQQFDGIPTTSYPPKALPKTYGDSLPVKGPL